MRSLNLFFQILMSVCWTETTVLRAAVIQLVAISVCVMRDTSWTLMALPAMVRCLSLSLSYKLYALKPELAIDFIHSDNSTYH